MINHLKKRAQLAMEIAKPEKGDVILDIFAGSGSTLVAAKKNNRNFLGCDADPTLVKIARQRLKTVEQL